MGEFFRGWRRKFGVLTLIMACSCVAIWMRSFEAVDFLAFADSHDSVSLRSLKGRLEWHRDIYNTQVANTLQPWQYRQLTLNHYQMIYLAEGGDAADEDMTFGYSTNFTHPLIYTTVYYWHLAIPLTLLSAYLLLVRPQVTKPPKNIEPIPAEAP